MSDSIYQWFVIQGRLALWIDQGACMLEVDEGDASHCTLSAQDAHDISGILGMLAQRIWEQSAGKAKPRTSSYRSDRARHHAWALEEGSLEIWTDGEHIFVQAPCSEGIELSLTMAVEIVQVLAHLETSVS